MESKESKKVETKSSGVKNKPTGKGGKSKKVKRKGTVATLAAVLLITGAGSSWLMYKGAEQAKAVSGAYTNEKTYESGLNTKDSGMEDNSQLNKVTTAELTEAINDGDTKILYLGRPTCPSCQKYRPIQDKVLKDMDMKIDYYNTDDAKVEDKEGFKKILETLSVQGVPTLVKVSGGKVVDDAPGEAYSDTSGKALTDWLTKVR
ncbi:thioredoxin family protein [Bacillus mycoides]|uniref:thioredoxin family protein n=1 Tax=Bacillus mycoides TaxID=1405 RepID=UPI003A80B433